MSACRHGYMHACMKRCLRHAYLCTCMLVCAMHTCTRVCQDLMNVWCMPCMLQAVCAWCMHEGLLMCACLGACWYKWVIGWMGWCQDTCIRVPCACPQTSIHVCMQACVHAQKCILLA